MCRVQTHPGVVIRMPRDASKDLHNEHKACIDTDMQLVHPQTEHEHVKEFVQVHRQTGLVITRTDAYKSSYKLKIKPV